VCPTEVLVRGRLDVAVYVGEDEPGFLEGNLNEFDLDPL